MATRRMKAKKIFAVVLLVGSVGASLLLIALRPAAMVSAQGPTPTLIPGVPVITPPPTLPTLDPTQFPTDGTPEPPPGGSPTPPPAPNPIQQIIRYFFQIFFPANTFREAIEGAARAIFEGTIEELRDPLTVVLDLAIFENGAVFGNVALPGELSTVADIMTRAAVPLWALSLALMALSVLTRQAVGMGYGSNEVAAEAARWFFIALASGNGFVLVSFVHAGFGLLAREIAGLNRVSAGAMVDALLRGAVETPILILIIMVFIAIITIFVVIVTYVARYAVTIAIAALAPVAIACEGIPYLRFVCRDWLSMFLRVELLQIVNLCVLVLFGHMMLFGGADGLVGSILRMVAMVGLASALIGINTAVFKQVFGVAIEAAQQMRVAVEQLVGGLAAVAGMALTGSPAPMLGMARPSEASTSIGRDSGLLPSSSTDDSAGASRVAGGSGGAHYGSTGSATSTAAGGESASASSSRRAAYRLGNAGSSSTTSAAIEQEDHSGGSKVANGSAEHSSGSDARDASNPRNAGVGRIGGSADTQSTSDAKQNTGSIADARPLQAASTPRRGVSANAQSRVSEETNPNATSGAEADATQRASADADKSDVRDREPTAAVGESGAASTSPTPMVEGEGRQENNSSDVSTNARAGEHATDTSTTQSNSHSGQAHHERADFRSAVSQAGVMARAVSRGTRLGGIAGAALRGFGEGAGDLMRRQAASDLAVSNDGVAPSDLVQTRGERFARYTLGADSPDDAHHIAAQLAHPPDGASIGQMREAYEAVAPIARDMARQYGSPARAAAQGGYDSYGELVTTLASERLRAQGQASSEPATGAGRVPGPVEAWTSASPGQSRGLTPYDYGVGAMVSGHLGAHPAAAPEWARTVQSLRQAYGDHGIAGSMLSNFVGQVESGQLGIEREAMQWLEAQVQQQPPSGGQLVDLWWRAGASDSARHMSAGTPQYDAGQSQAERFARFALGAETPSDVHAIAAQLSSAQSGQGGYSSEQMREAYEAIAPLARDMRRQFGSSTRAAAVGGYDSYGQLVGRWRRSACACKAYC